MVKMKMRNPKLLSLLRQGCSITFSSGIVMRQVLQDDTIEVGMQPDDGEDFISIDGYALTEQGLEEALQYEEFYASRSEDEERLKLEEHEEEMQ